MILDNDHKITYINDAQMKIEEYIKMLQVFLINNRSEHVIDKLPFKLKTISLQQLHSIFADYANTIK